jgi:hypothetical protein
MSSNAVGKRSHGADGLRALSTNNVFAPTVRYVFHRSANSFSQSLSGRFRITAITFIICSASEVMKSDNVRI